MDWICPESEPASHKALPKCTRKVTVKGQKAESNGIVSSFKSRGVCLIGPYFPGFNMTVFLFSCKRLKKLVETQWEAGDAASLAAASSVSARQQLRRLELSLPIDVSLAMLCWLPARPVCHLWHPRSTQGPQLHTAPKMVSWSTAAQPGNARHTQQPGSD